MKKFLAVVAVSALALSACGGSKATDSDAKAINLADFLVEIGCSTAKYDGDVPEAEQKAINDKYGFASDAEIETAMKAAIADKDKIEADAIAKIEAKCKEDFVKGGVDPKEFLDILFGE